MDFVAPSVRNILAAYGKLLTSEDTEVCQTGISFPIPVFSQETLIELSEEAIRVLQKRPNILKISAPIYVIGDLHGNLCDLIRIINLAKPPPYSRYLFLGDYVDRGKYSIEVVTFLLALQVAFPEHIYMLRGNHEFEQINENYGFKNEVQTQYDSLEVYFAFNKVFEWLSLVAIINDKIFCVHGGLSPQLSTLEQISLIHRPFQSFESNLVSDILWSDPSPDTNGYIRSARGTGVIFGKEPIDNFIKSFNFSAVIRAHQCVSTGISRFLSTQFYTVFSCSNYDENTKNKAGLIFIKPDLSIQGFSLPALRQVDRLYAEFENFEEKPTLTLPLLKPPSTIAFKKQEMLRTNKSCLSAKTKVAQGCNRFFYGSRSSESFPQLSSFSPLVEK